MQFFFVGDIRSGKSILDEIRKMGTLVGLAVSDRNLEQASEVDVSILKEATLNTPEGIEKLRDLSIDVLINFNSLTIFSSASLSSLKIGGVNFHPGLLPEYSGSNVHQWAILNGEKSTGVSIHVMNEKVDSGAVLSQSFVDVELRGGRRYLGRIGRKQE